MKKVLYHFFVFKVSEQGDILREWFLVENCDTLHLSIMYKLEGSIHTEECSISYFEHNWKINIADLSLELPDRYYIERNFVVAK